MTNYRKKVVSYYGAHVRLRKERGKARDHRCVDCKGPADEWSLTDRSNVLVDARDGSTYSLKLDDYDPRCRSCHRSRDDNKAAHGEEHYRTKLTERDVLDIRILVDNEADRREIAECFGITVQTVNRIGRRRSWSWLPEED